MQSGSNNDFPVLSRFIYDERCLRDDGHPRKDIFIGPKSTRDISVDRHGMGVDKINWYAGGAVKLGLTPVASAEVLAEYVTPPLYVKPYSVPRMPLHADISGWQDSPGWGENKELAKELAKKAICVRNPNMDKDQYDMPHVSFVVNCIGDLEIVVQKFRCLKDVSRSDFECVCYVDEHMDNVVAAINQLAIWDRRIVAVTLDRSNAKEAFMTLLSGPVGARGDIVVFVALTDAVEDAMNVGNVEAHGFERSSLIEKVDNLRFETNGDIKVS